MTKAEFTQKEDDLFLEEINIRNKRLELQHKYEKELLKHNGYNFGDTVLVNKTGEKCKVYGVHRGLHDWYLWLKKIKKDGTMSLQNADGDFTIILKEP